MISIMARKQEQSTTRCVSPHAKEYTTDMILDSLDSLFQRMIAQPALNGAGSLAELLLKIHWDGWGGLDEEINKAELSSLSINVS